MIIQGNALHLPLKDGTVQCCVTSPPYYGLRDYGVDDQIGLESTPDEYVAKLVSVFREVKRVLKDDGVLWLNLGDSYAGSGNGSNDHREDGASLSKNNDKYKGQKPGFDFGRQGASSTVSKLERGRGTYNGNGCKPKDLIGIPWMVAFALRADGWYLRSDIIWAKPNPMPESVKDRPTKAHEYVFLLAKSQKYYYDNEAIMEASIDKESYTGRRKRNPLSMVKYDAEHCTDKRDRTGETYPNRNKRSVWTITTQPFKGAHFAVMPEKLVEPCVLAGTSEYGQCPKCGANWVRVTDHKVSESKTTNRINNDRNDAGRTQFINAKTETLGWQPTCNCNAGREPNIVLDPFAGSGTVGVVAQKHGRQFIGIELNPDYVKLAEARLLATPQSLFNQSVLQETP